MAERVERMFSTDSASPDKGSSRWKQILKWGIIGTIGLALVLAVL